MYCPKCGVQNNDDIKFCRSCGENLKVISQAMDKRLPAVLERKLDSYLEGTNERMRNQSIFGAFAGFLMLFAGIREWLVGSQSAVWIPILVGCFFLLQSIWIYLAYRRSLHLAQNANKTLPVTPTTNELPPLSDVARIAEQPLASVTEYTTKHLDTTIRRQEKTYPKD
ncbi:MAG: zinc ribbon domain-containing protein [Acidobacteriota bacterium]|nr:zinc ribbon domain-containing protein [Acidobacteriota bacterium]